MARGENPQALLAIQTTLTYDATKPFGHADAGKDLQLEIIETGSDAGKARLATAGKRLIGKFVDLDKNGVASYMPRAVPMLMKQSAADACKVGQGVVGALKGSDAGYVAAPAARTSSYVQATEQEWSDAQGQVIAVVSNTAGGDVLVIFP